MIINNVNMLIQDPFGNYLVQNVFELQDQNQILRIIEQIKDSFYYLSTQKFSSNVIEKCLEACGPEAREYLFDSIADSEEIQILLYDPFGNYVFQKMLSLSHGTRRFDQFINLVADNKENLRNHKYGKKIIIKIANCFPDLDRTLKLSSMSKFNEKDFPKQRKYSGASKTTKKPQ